MKKNLLLIFIFLIIATCGFAQVPGAFNYQAVVRNSSGEIIANQNVSFRISIMQNSATGSPVYVETHSANTNNFGLANLMIGKGSAVSGIFLPGGWGVASHFLKVEIDPSGGSAFVHLGTTQLLSVPYAFHANTVENDKVDDADADPGNEIQTLNLSGTELTLSDGGGTVSLTTSGDGDDWGAQTVISDETIEGKGTTVAPLSVNGDLTDDQMLSILGNDLSITGGNTVELPDNVNDADADPANELQNLSIVGNDLSIIGGNTVELPDNVNDADADPANELQNLSIVRNVLSISSGNSVTLPLGSTSLWTESNDDIYYDTGSVGVGGFNNALPHTFQVNGTAATAILKSTTGDASFDFDRKSVALGDALLMFATNGLRKFRIGLYSGEENLWISGDYGILKGIEVQKDGDIRLSDELHSSNTGTSNMMPFAYGHITSTGTKNSATSNVGTTTRSATGRYIINISGLGSDYIAIVTPNQGVAYLTGVVTARGSTSITVAMWDTKNDAYKDGGFSFVIYKP